MSTDFNRAELETLLKSVDMLDELELLEIEKMIEELDKRATLQATGEKFPEDAA